MKKGFTKMAITFSLLVLSISLQIGTTIGQPSITTCSRHSFRRSNFSHCIDLPFLGAYLHWTYYPSSGTADIAYRVINVSPDYNWIAWALNFYGSGMLGAQALVAYQQNSSGAMHAYTSSVDSYAIATLVQSTISFEVSNLTASSNGNNEMIIFATIRPPRTAVNQVWQVGLLSGGAPGNHINDPDSDNTKSLSSIDFQSGQANFSGAVVIPRLRRKKSKNIDVAASVPTVIAILLLVLGVCFCIYRHKSADPSPDEEEFIAAVNSLKFDFKTIRNATENFSMRNKLGQGGFGGVYKGKLNSGQEIAVKRLSTNSGQGIEEFKTEVLLVEKLQHMNLVKLLGFCLHGEEKLLVYELLPNASLDKVLLGRNRQPSLDWDTRYKILLGTARGLLYLHEDSRLKIIHRDLKMSNILLDGDMNPKIADFGLARLVGRDQIQADTSKIAGTYGYMAPEYALTGRFSLMSDVYSFGVIVLEIVSGRMCSSTTFPYEDESLCLRAWRLWKDGDISDFVDPRLDGNFSSEEVTRCIHIGLLCIQEDAKKRPTMAPIVSALNGHHVVLLEPEPPQLSPTNIILSGSYQEGMKPSSRASIINDDDTEIYPR